LSPPEETGAIAAGESIEAGEAGEPVTAGEPGDPGDPLRGLAEVAAFAERLTAGDLDALERALADDPAAVVPDEPRTRAIVGLLHPFTGDPADAERRRAERRELLALAHKAIDHLRRRLQGSPVAAARLDRDGQIGAALLALLTARPAIRVVGGTFEAPRTPPWQDLDTYRGPIAGLLPSVGRIEAAGLPAGYAGTGFMAGEGLVLTNRHVALVLAHQEAARQRSLRAERRPVQIDFGEEHRPGNDPGGPVGRDADPDVLVSPRPDDRPDNGAATTFEIAEVLGWHDRFDLAVLRVAARSRDGSRALPPPVPLAPDGGRVREGLRAFLVGYPGREENNFQPVLMDGLFQRIYHVKHLQPGTVMNVFLEGEDRGQIQHDCSTLPGNSGSCLADLETGDVFGLHYGGFHGRFNLAVALWTLRDDPFLRRFDLSWAA
jgi:Trypsin-like peptidase domain